MHFLGKILRRHSCGGSANMIHICRAVFTLHLTHCYSVVQIDPLDCWIADGKWTTKGKMAFLHSLTGMYTERVNHGMNMAIVSSV
jgi:hypothetical protein